MLGGKGDINAAWSYDAYAQYYYTTFFTSNDQYMNFTAIDQALLVTADGKLHPLGRSMLQRLSRVFLALLEDKRTRADINLILISAGYVCGFTDVQAGHPGIQGLGKFDSGGDGASGSIRSIGGQQYVFVHGESLDSCDIGDAKFMPGWG